MTESEEVKYWQRFIEGDLDALSVLFLLYAKGLISYGMKIYRDEELVKDSIQEVFIQLIQKRHKLNRNNNKGLVYRLLRNKLIDEIKMIKKSMKIDNYIFTSNKNFEINAESQCIIVEEDNHRNRTLASALDELSARQREAMFLKYADGLYYEQISEVLGISIASARTLIYRALKQIKSIMVRY